MHGHKMKPSIQRCSEGYSILELYTVIVIALILISFATPTFEQFLIREEREATLERLKTAIEYAKQEAFIRQENITLCGSADHHHCQAQQWTAGFIIFVNPTLSDQPHLQQILRVFPGIRHGQLIFKQFGQHLNIQPNGMTFNTGTFFYCPANKERLDIDGLVINKGCRTYKPTKHPILGIPLKNPETPMATSFTCR